MLSIGSLGAGKGHYYTNLAREDYYLEGGEPPGRWFGRGAKALRFDGQVTKDDLQKILEGFSKNGEKLVQNAGKTTGKRHRQAGLDLTFSADKSVSVLWALGDADTRQAIELAHGRAVEVALQYLQLEAGWTRTGKAGETFERCELVFAEFVHSTSRAQEMNLHTHVLVPNVGVRADGKTSALWNNELYQHKMAAGALYRVALAYELGPRGLGFAIESHKDRPEFFRLRDVPQKVCDFFSTRRKQIEEQMQEHGYSTAKAADAANRATREVKGHVSRAELMPCWDSQATEIGFGASRRTTLAPRDKAEIAGPNLAEELEKQAQRLAREEATFRPQDLLRAAAESVMDGRTNPFDLHRASKDHLEQDSLAVVATGKRHSLYTTKVELRREENILRLGSALSEQRGLTVSSEWAHIVKQADERTLDTAERQAAFDYLTTDPGNLKVLAGVAGTGKTSLLGAARSAWEKQGFRVVGMALAGKASRELEQGAGIETETVRKRQLQLEPTFEEQADYHGQQIRRAARWGRYKGYEESPMERMKLDAKTVVVIDESSMLSLEDMSQMLRLANTAGAKVVLVGDENQLAAIEAVSPFEALGKHVGRFELTEVKRQRHPWMREAVRAFAFGDAATGLSLLKEHGCLHMGKGGPEATKDLLIADWMNAKGRQAPGLVESLLPEVLARTVRGPDKLILALTNADAAELNQLAQTARSEAGELGSIPVTLGSGEKARRGDRIIFGQNSERFDVSNGDLGTVVKVHRPIDANPFAKGEVTVELDRGGRVRVNLNKYEETSLGYALTTHKAQGSTVDSVFVYTTVGSARQDLMYVQASRARDHMAVYCPGHDLGEDLADLERSLGRDTSDQLAIQLQADSERRGQVEAEQQRLRELAEEELRNRDDYGRERTR